MNAIYQGIIGVLLFAVVMLMLENYRTAEKLYDSVDEYAYREFIPEEMYLDTVENILGYPEDGRPYRVMVYDLDEKNMHPWTEIIPESWRATSVGNLEVLILMKYEVKTIEEKLLKVPEENRWIKLTRKQNVYTCYAVDWKEKILLKKFYIKGAKPAEILENEYLEFDTDKTIYGAPITPSEFITELGYEVNGIFKDSLFIEKKDKFMFSTAEISVSAENLPKSSDFIDTKEVQQTDTGEITGEYSDDTDDENTDDPADETLDIQLW